MKEEATNRRADEAVRRFEIIAPILAGDNDKARKAELYEEISKEYDISVRTIRRYEKGYRENGLKGLEPKKRKPSGPKALPENFDELLQQAIELRREVPKRSVTIIIRTLELEGRVPPGVLKRTTLQKHLYAAGFGRRQLKQYDKARTGSTGRFCKPHRMMLLEADIKEEQNVPVGPDNTIKTIYLTSIIDDHSRTVPVSDFYFTESAFIVEDTFREAILQVGKPDEIYVDNGTQYISMELRSACAELGIRIRHAPLRSGQSKGVIERFHQTVDRFIQELKLKHADSLDEINQWWHSFYAMMYTNTKHEGIAEYYLQNFGIKVPQEGITPQQEWNRDTRQLVFLDKDRVARAFLHHEKRRVDHGACIRFNGKKYEAKMTLIGVEVEIEYDPRNPDVITVYHEGMKPFESKPMKLGEFCAPRPKLPEYMTPEKPTTSRVIDALMKHDKETPRHRADGLSFADYKPGGENSDV